MPPQEGTQRFVEGWFCPDHKAKCVNAANERRLLGGEDLEAGEDLEDDDREADETV